MRFYIFITHDIAATRCCPRTTGVKQGRGCFKCSWAVGRTEKPRSCPPPSTHKLYNMLWGGGGVYFSYMYVVSMEFFNFSRSTIFLNHCTPFVIIFINENLEFFIFKFLFTFCIGSLFLDTGHTVIFPPCTLWHWPVVTNHIDLIFLGTGSPQSPQTLTFWVPQLWLFEF